MEDFILDSVTFIGNIDFSFVLRMFFFIYLFFWIMVVIWVWYDASERSSNVLFKVFSVLITLLFNVFGLLIYLLVRPADSYEERYLNELEKKYLQLETSGITKCPACGFDIEPSFVVCPKCGEPVKVKCDNCQEYIDSNWEFCADCGVEREVSEAVKGDYPEIVEEELYNKKGSYRAALSQCVFKVGEKQNQCIEKARELFRKNLKKKPAQKDEIVESKAKTKKSKKKSKKKKKRK